jgi:hypothetical protein
VIFKFLFFFALSFNLYAALGIEIELDSGKKIFGEYIETYEDRWFYQAPLDWQEHYVLVFDWKNNKPHFDFIQLAQVKTVQLKPYYKMDLRSHLKKIGLSLNQEMVKEGRVLTGHEGHHKHEMMFGNFAWDFGILDENAWQYKNAGRDLEDYYIFYQPVYSPYDGTIVDLHQDAADNLPDPLFETDLSGLRPNYILMLLDYPFYFSMVHFAKDRVNVALGESVKKGQLLGLVGNSGVSYIPHLHVTMFLYLESLDRFISIPTPSDRYPVQVLR